MKSNLKLNQAPPPPPHFLFLETGIEAQNNDDELNISFNSDEVFDRFRGGCLSFACIFLYFLKFLTTRLGHLAILFS